MNRIGLLLVVTLISMSGSFLIAAAKCNPNDETTVGMHECAAENLSKADKKLNVTYQQLMKQLDASNKKKLVAAESAWIKFRDLHCGFSAGFYQGGTFYPIAVNDCHTQLTEQRIKMLQDELSH